MRENERKLENYDVIGDNNRRREEREEVKREERELKGRDRVRDRNYFIPTKDRLVVHYRL